MVNAQKHLNPKCSLDFPYTMFENTLVMIDRLTIGKSTFFIHTFPIDIPNIKLEAVECEDLENYQKK